MSLAVVSSATLVGVEGRAVTVEAHISNGIPGYTVVGLPDTAVRESRDRVRAALMSSGLTWPQKRITVNLAPSALRKTGAGLDLPLALSVLLASDQLPAGCLDRYGVLGEVGLDGSIRPVPGVLALVATLAEHGVDTVIVPERDAAEASLVPDVQVRAAGHVATLHACLKGEAAWPDHPPAPSREHEIVFDDEPLDLRDVRGLAGARTALAAAAAAGHHLLLVGPPGVGKTMLARRIPSILPPLTPDEAFEVTRIQSAMGEPTPALVRRRPFRSPHHTATTAALVGGGSTHLKPGEVTRAHRGVLFLDELGEFRPSALDALRQPLEERAVRIARQATSLEFPAAFTLVAASNPCPCGLGPPGCTCDDGKRSRYRQRLSAPLLDRFDLRILVTAPEPGDAPGDDSSRVRERIVEAVARQASRYRHRPWARNADVPAGALTVDLPLSTEAADALHDIAAGDTFTARGVSGVRRVARTLADLDESAEVEAAHVLHAGDLRQEVLG